MNIYINDNGFAEPFRLLKSSIDERIPTQYSSDGLQLELIIDKSVGVEESYCIRSQKEGWQIVGADEAGLFYGIGKLLHTAKWSEDSFAPNPPTQVMTPNSSFRAVYFSVHFYNWYHRASAQELGKYLEELLLWGYNAIVCIIPIINLNSFEEPLFFESVEKVRTIFQLAKKLGMKVGIILGSNQGLKTAPEAFDADPSFDVVGTYRAHFGRNLCPSKPGVVEYMRDIWITTLRQFEDIGLDYVITWPYDEGGCGCSQCRPWGANAYCDLVNKIHEESVKLYPEIKFIVSTWLFDTPDNEGEFEGFYQRLKGDLSYVDYIMADSHDAFPRFVLEHEPVKPVVNFPEISMWKLSPWGGRGANPQPRRFQEIWDSAKHILKGGMPYSEGMYEDILKIQCVGYYWEPDRSYRNIMQEYINYEYGAAVCQEVLELLELLEDNHVGMSACQEPDVSEILRAEELAKTVDQQLDSRARKSWRWRILYIRAVLDRMVCEYYEAHDKGDPNALNELRHTPEAYLAENTEAQKLLQELCGYYHCVSKNGENIWTLPPVKDGIVLNTFVK